MERIHKNSERYKEIKRTRFSCQDFVTMCGFNPYVTRLQIWTAMKNKEEIDYSIRKHCEQSVADWFASETKTLVIDRSNNYAVIGDDPIVCQLYCKPTRTYYVDASHVQPFSDENKGILYTFTTNNATDAVLKYHLLVANLSCFVFGWREYYVAWLDSYFNFHYQRFEFDDAARLSALGIIQEASDFLTNFYTLGIPPEPITKEDILLAHPEIEKRATKVADDRIKGYCEEYLRISEQIKTKQATRDSISVLIQHYMGHCCYLVDEDNNRLATISQTEDKTVLDVDRVMKKYPNACKKNMMIKKGYRRFVVEKSDTENRSSY